MDNSSSRLIEVFFYGLYMDDSILKNRDVVAKNKRVASVNGYRLRIGKNATLLRDEGSKAYGVICSLTHNDIYKLYAGAGLTSYVPETLTVRTNNNKSLTALCYVLLDPPLQDEINNNYYQKLILCMKECGLPIPQVSIVNSFKYKER